jgi:mitogen-activated protein kinase kinase kinase
MKTRTTAEGQQAIQPGELAGTPMYMAPEVIRSNEKSSGRLGAADIWSLGCVVLEISTGKKPWSNLDNEWYVKTGCF